MDTFRNNMIAHYDHDTSDNIYLACVRRNADGNWSVIGKYGRRGRKLKSQTKLSGVDEMTARSEQAKLFKSKLKKGYLDVESTAYSGPVNRTSKSVRPYLEPEGTGSSDGDSSTKTPQPPPPPSAPPAEEPSTDLIVVCKDNAGIEDRFDVGIEYVAEKADDDDMLKVYDKFGNADEYFMDRFVVK